MVLWRDTLCGFGVSLVVSGVLGQVLGEKSRVECIWGSALVAVLVSVECEGCVCWVGYMSGGGVDLVEAKEGLV
jgi:hypothetical protein